MHGGRPRAALFAWLLALWLADAAADQTLLAPVAPARAGDEITLELLVTNDSAQPRVVAPADELAARLIADQRGQNVTLARVDRAAASVELQPQGFRRIAYRVRLPYDFVGPVTLRATQDGIAPVMFMIVAEATAQPAAEAAPTDAAAGSRSAAAGSDAAGPDVAGSDVAGPTAIGSDLPGAAGDTLGAVAPPPAPLSREAAFLSAFTGYEPVYFAAGPREDWSAKFQVSFKFRFFNDEAALARRFHVLEHLYLGYTQTSLWDLGSPSSPFRDTSYKPRLFYADPESWHMRGFPLRLGFEGGLGHESNGRGGDESRSINVVYLRPSVVIGAPGDWQWTIAPSFNDYLDAQNNPDISDYRGYVDLYTSIGKADSWQLAALLRKGDGGRWTSQFDLSYPLRSVALGNLNGYLLFQFFDGWGESILDYDRRLAAQYRVGLMFVR